MATVNKIDSNSTGLRYAEEDTIGNLPGSGVVWNPLEPNSYSDFGGQISTTARRPINASRQRKKGVVTDLDASGGFNMDLTQENFQDILQGFFFADLRRKGEAAENSVPIVDVDGSTEQYTLSNRELTAVAVNSGGSGYVVGDTLTLDGTGATSSTAVSLTVASVSGGAITGLTITESGRYSVDPTTTTANNLSGGSGTGATADLTFSVVVDFDVGDLIFASNFADDANNGLKTINTVDATGTILTVDEDLTTDASPASTADLVIVGLQGAAGDFDIDASGSLPKLTNASTDLTTLGLIAGEWIFIGGDATGDKFSTAANNGFARIRSIAAGEITLDKTQSTMVTEASTTETVQIFFGRVLKNENDSTLITRRTYHLERTLGQPDSSSTDTQAEYLKGSVPNELTFNFDTADKITADLSFVSTDNEQVTAGSLKSGTRPTITDADAYNTTNDFSRLKMVILDDADSNPDALFAYLSEFTITINNNASPNKAISVLGAFDVTVGNFDVGGTATAYFSTIEAVQAVRNNSDVSIDFALVKSNAGLVVDVPLIALGDGRLDVSQDEPITLPLEMPAAEDPNFNHTLLMTFFDYLPSAADA